MLAGGHLFRGKKETIPVLAIWQRCIPRLPSAGEWLKELVELGLFIPDSQSRQRLKRLRSGRGRATGLRELEKHNRGSC